MQRRTIIGILAALLTLWALACQAVTLNIPPEQALRIGVKIWYNEAGGTVSKLTSWNRGEQFASVGIGHFIWYPKRHRGSYPGSFATLIHYMQDHNTAVPYWLRGRNGPYCPWRTRRDFMAAQHSPRMIALRQFLYDTIPMQVAFMLHRLKQALPRMLAAVSYGQRNELRQQFKAVAQSPNGLYALMDYVNFKGLGTEPRRGYNYEGWGLIQVLQQMKYAPSYMTNLQAFVWAANNCLTRRVENEPPDRHDERWLAGWRHRLMTYLQ